MFKISKNKLITITRGDSGEILVPLNLGTTIEPDLHELTENDTVYLGITEPNKPFECAIIRKVIEGKDNLGQTFVNFKLNPLDTEYLMPGTYYYSIKLKEDVSESEYEVYTILDKRKFNIID